MSLQEFAMESNAWPFEEARRILKRIGDKTPAKGYVLFETGYGPSGLPHIGTFGEVLRTTMVRHAFSILAPSIPTKLFAVSDDLDGLRKVPDTIPDKEKYQKYCPENPEIGGVSLTSIPDPFGTHASFGAHMNARLCAFLDAYRDLGIAYEFKSATECYQSGVFDAVLLKVVKHHQKICDKVIPKLGGLGHTKDRAKNYSPILPIEPETNRPLHVAVRVVDAEKGIIAYINPRDGKEVETLVTGGRCKLQWRADWGMRWDALGVDYEMHGKDLIPSAELSQEICKIIGGKPPELYKYELFLDEKGEKISKSKGNGLSMDEWLRYAPKESLAYYMYQNPNRAKRLYFDVIPKAVDEYLTFLGKYETQTEAEKLANPVWHIHAGNPPKPESPLSFALLLNLASACHAEDASVLLGFISRYAPNATPQNAPHLDELVKHALHYYSDFVKPTQKTRAPNEKERGALESLLSVLSSLPSPISAEEIQNHVYTVGKEHGFENLREWFQALYEILLGQSQGPRFGSFVELYGIQETCALIRKSLDI